MSCSAGVVTIENHASIRQPFGGAVKAASRRGDRVSSQASQTLRGSAARTPGYCGVIFANFCKVANSSAVCGCAKKSHTHNEVCFAPWESANCAPNIEISQFCISDCTSAFPLGFGSKANKCSAPCQFHPVKCLIGIYKSVYLVICSGVFAPESSIAAVATKIVAGRSPFSFIRMPRGMP